MAVHPEGLARATLLVCAILLGFSWLTVILRTIARVKIRSFGLDDWSMAAGLILFSAASSSAIVSCFYGVGTPDAKLDLQLMVKGRMWLFLAQFFYIVAIIPIKVAICVAMLRITTLKWTRWALYGIMILASAASFITAVTLLSWCKPTAAQWTGVGKCANPQILTNVSYFISASSILTDWACAILPAVILWKIQLRSKIKVPVAIVLGFGFVASSATIVRFKYLLAYTSTENYLHNVANVVIWSITELGLGIIAGSLATLRPLLKTLPMFRSHSTGQEGTNSKPSRPYNSFAMQSYGADRHKTHVQGGYSEWDRLSDAESQQKIIRKPSGKAGAKEIKVFTETEIVESKRYQNNGHLGTIDRFDSD